MYNLMKMSVFLSFLFLLPGSLKAQNTVLHWAWTYPNISGGGKIVRTGDSTLALVAADQIINIDLHGDTLGRVDMPMPVYDFLVEENGDFIIASNDTGAQHKVARIDPTGTVVWEHPLDFTVSSVIGTPDKGYLAGGGNSLGAVLVCLDPARTELWRKEYRNADYSDYLKVYHDRFWVKSLDRLSTGGYVFSGENSVVLVDSMGQKTDGFSLGNGITDSWSMSYDRRYINTVKGLPDSGYVFGHHYKKYKHNPTGLPGHEWGIRTQVNMGYAKLVFSETDDGRNVNYTYTHYDVNAQRPDTFLVLGTKYDSGLEPIIKLFGSGTQLYTFPRVTENKGIIPRSSAVIDGDCYIISGSIGGDLWLAKIGPESKVPVNAVPPNKMVLTKLKLKINNQVFWLDRSVSGGFSLAIYDIQGKLVSQCPVQDNGINQLSFNGISFVPGLYLAGLRYGNGINAKKVMLIK